MALLSSARRARRTPPLPPETVGGQGSDLGAGTAVVDCGAYRDGTRLPDSTTYTEALHRVREHGGFVWIGLHEPGQAELDAIGAQFGLHPLAIEDAVKAHQRPKVDRYDELVFAVFKTVRYVPHEQLTATSQIVETGEVMVAVGNDFVVTVRHGQHGGLHGIRQGLEARPELMSQGPAAVLYAVADQIVDDYVEVAELVQDDIDEIEAAVFSGQRGRDVERIYQLKREVLELKRAVAPLVLPMKLLAERGPGIAESDLREYFHDVEDHVIRVRDQVTGYDELLTSILQANLAQVQAAQNEDMRKISAWVAIVAVPTMIAGIYGMNFDNMPELHWRFGYLAALIVMVSACWLLHRGFKRNGWL